MEWLIGALVVIAIIVIAVAVNRRNNGEESTTVATDDRFAGVKPPTSFAVEGSTAIATFDLEVPDDGPDETLRSLLLRQGREAIRANKATGITRLSIRAWRGGHVTEVASTDIGAALDVSDESVMPQAEDVDPLAVLAEADFGQTTVAGSTGGTLAPLAQELTLTSGIKTALAASGVDVTSMTATQLTIGLLEQSGYQVSKAEVPGTYIANRGGTRTFIMIVDHEPGDYPELSEEAVNSFMVRFVSSGAQRGLLFSDKYGPFVVYDKEKREPRVRFITRERLQHFVDSVALA